jgi:hypothetical protein
MSRNFAAYGGEERCGNLKGRSHLEDLDVDGRVILKWLFKKCDGAWT